MTVQDLWESNYQILLIILQKELIKKKCKNKHDNKKFEKYGIKCKHCDCFLGYTNIKGDLIKYKYLFCIKTYQK